MRILRTRCSKRWGLVEISAIHSDVPPTPKRIAWRRLLSRVFSVHLTRCPLCEGPLKIIEAVVDPTRIAVLPSRPIPSHPIPSRPAPARRPRVCAHIRAQNSAPFTAGTGHSPTRLRQSTLRAITTSSVHLRRADRERERSPGVAMAHRMDRAAPTDSLRFARRGTPALLHQGRHQLRAGTITPRVHFCRATGRFCVHQAEPRNALPRSYLCGPVAYQRCHTQRPRRVETTLLLSILE